MTDRIQIAQAFIKEQLQASDDIIAVLVVGSAVSGEVTAFSDVDLRLIVEGRKESKLQREGIDRWVDGIYVDATFAAANDYASAEHALADRGSADTMNFGRILHDPTGRFAILQQEVQARYMEPEWLHVRVNPLVNLVTERLPALRQAIDNQDPLNVHIHAGRVFAGLGFIPLLQEGTAVSSSRSMMQLVKSQPIYAQCLLDVEGATTYTANQVSEALDIFSALSELDPHREYATLAGYMVGKARWMARNGYHQEAVHTTWLHSGNRAAGTAFAGSPEAVVEARKLSTQWLSAVGWVGESVLRDKVAVLDVIWTDLEAMATAVR